MVEIATPNYGRPGLLEGTARSWVEHYGRPAEGGYRWTLVDDGSDAATRAAIERVQGELGCWAEVVWARDRNAVRLAFEVLSDPRRDAELRVYMESDYRWERGGWLEFAAGVLGERPEVGEVLAEHLPGTLDRNEAAGCFKRVGVGVEDVTGVPYQVNRAAAWGNRLGQYSMRVHLCRAGLYEGLRPFPRLTNREMEWHIGRWFHARGLAVATPHVEFATHVGARQPAVPYT